MAPEAFVPTAHAEIPHDLYRDIIDNLHHLSDRHTLLHLSLVSKAWCTESQRVLFRTVWDNSTDLDKREALIHTHTLFLEAIISNPSQLGSHVQAYKQPELICHPDFAALISASVASANSYLRDLTEKALPALVNLKHLFIDPGHSHIFPPRALLLEGCTFKLKSLKWGFELESEDPSSINTFVKFLRTQHDLVRLEVGYEPSMQDFSWLPDDVCPNLMSAACRLESAVRLVAKRRNITGLKTWNNARDSSQPTLIPQSHLSVLHGLKYLSILLPRVFMSHYGTINSHTILVELQRWNKEIIQILSGFPNIRVVALVKAAPEGSLPSLQASMATHIPVEVECDLQMQATIESFHHCPNLKYVIIEGMRRDRGPRRFRKLSIAGYSTEPDSKPDIQSEEFFIDHELGKPWWTAYGMK